MSKYRTYGSSGSKRRHVCDTDSPQRACCWAARKAELDALSSNTAMPDPRPEHKAAIDRALRGED
jgi:hypothetical protein